MGAFAVVTGDEDFTFGDNNIDFARSVSFGTVGTGDTSGIVGVEAAWVFVVEYR